MSRMSRRFGQPAAPLTPAIYAISSDIAAGVTPPRRGITAVSFQLMRLLRPPRFTYSASSHQHTSRLLPAFIIY